VCQTVRGHWYRGAFNRRKPVSSVAQPSHECRKIRDRSEETDHDPWYAICCFLFARVHFLDRLPDEYRR
jgi:hypothetical protein